ncbi:MAG: FmdB family zinc ribbon protein [Endomicrobiia bacterium]
MPVYEYVCKDCKTEFEVSATLEEKEKGLKPKCPNCGSENIIRFFGSANFINFFDKSSSFNSGSCCGPNGRCSCG